ncbi:MAG: hypothetical protein HY315_09970 [Acidobacteria bacterium]|nr:hypothetical protein [Acidobacteriota bacterium]
MLARGQARSAQPLENVTFIGLGALKGRRAGPPPPAPLQGAPKYFKKSPGTQGPRALRACPC